MPNTESDATRAVVEEFFARLGGGDIESALSLLAEPVDWFTPGSTQLIPWMGSRSTHDEVRDFFRQAGENMKPEVFEVHRIVVEGDTAIALGHFRYQVLATGKTFDSDFALELRVAGGRITRYHIHEDSYGISLAFLD